MPLKKTLIQANEAGPWNSQQPIINFSIPSNIGVVDMSQSSIILDVVVTDANGNALGLYDVQFANQYDPRCLVNYISLSTNKGGLVEEIQNSNVLSQNMLGFNKSTELLQSQSWLGQGQLSAMYGSFLTKYITGNKLSVQQCALPLPLKGLLGMGIQSQWLNQAWDGTNIQMNLDYMNQAGFFQQVKVENIPCEDVGDVASTTLVLTDKANDQCANPFYVGEALTVNYTPTFTPDAIVSISKANPAVITLTHSPSQLFIGAGNIVALLGITGVGWLGMVGNQKITAINEGAKTITTTVDSTGFTGLAPTALGTCVLSAYNPVSDIITAGTEADPCVITTTNSPTSQLFIVNGNTVTVAGFTGAWTVANGTWVVDAVNDGAKTMELVGLDTSGIGAIAGAPTITLIQTQRTNKSNVTTISSIALANDNTVTLTVNPQWNLVYYGGTNITVSSNTSGNADNTLSYRIDSAQLSLVQQVLMPNQITMMSKVLNTPSNLSFLSWGVQRLNMPTVGANSSLVQLIDLLPNCRQVMILVPKPANADPLHSSQDNQDSYRFSVDGVYTSNRAIVPYDSLYYNKLIEACANSKQVLANLVGVKDSVIWCQSIPTDGMRHQLQYQFSQNGNAGTANKIMYVFQCVDKSMNTQTAFVTTA